MTLHADERYDRINDSISLIQKKEGLTFGTDAYLLSCFVRRRPRGFAADLGCGTGVIALLCAARGKFAHIDAVELQQDFALLAQRNVEHNQMIDRITVRHQDIRELKSSDFGRELHAVFCNPPYMNGNWGFLSPSDKKAIARHEITINIDDVARIASYLLKFGGYFSIIHRTERLCDVICAMRKYKLEPKRIRFIHSYANSAPKLFLIEGISGAKSALKISEPLVIYGENGEYTDEVSRLYKGEN